MEVISHPSSHRGDENKCVAFISYLENGQLQGFECENVWIMDEALDGKKSEILDDLENYDMMETCHSRPKGLRWQRLLRGVFHKREHRQRDSTQRQRYGKPSKKSGYNSDTNTVSTSASSLSSYSSLEGFVITASKTAKDDDSSHVDPTLFEILSDIAAEVRETKGGYSSAEFEILKAHNLVFDDETACTERSESSSISSRSERSVGQHCLMERRLLDTGLVKRSDFDFVRDYVSKEVLHIVGGKNEDDPVEDEMVSHVKTGIWEVICLEDDGTPKKPYYVVTAVSMDDRVDTNKLRKFVFSGQQHKRRPKLGMAPTETAEGLAGYKSGTMAPICHSEKMKLYLEESLIQGVDVEKHRINVGSGMFGKCLSISARHFLEIAKANPSGLEICPVVRKA